MTADIAEWLKSIVYEVAEETKCEIIEMEVMLDHVHILCEVDPQFGVHKFVKLAKGRSSRYLRQAFPILTRRLPSLWTNSYMVVTNPILPNHFLSQFLEQAKSQ